ncbi:hypothetical protein ACP70R_024104 [Stipagrostis hirtigluma subsp. patula]
MEHPSIHLTAAVQLTSIMANLVTISLLAVGLLLPGAATAAGDDLAVFWGRNKDEGSLREACDTGRYTTVIVSFLSAFGHGNYTLDLSGHPPSAVGDDIKHCQSMGVLVLLSIGGPGGGDNSLPSPQSAADLADHLWTAYLAGSRAGVARPFGDAAVDGVDFFIDQGSAPRRTTTPGTGGEVMLTATTRCAYPDPRLEAALATGLFARIHVRMYGDLRCTWSPRESWEKWAAAYPGTRVLLGLVASPEADEDAYMFQKDLYYGVLQFIKKVPNYGGMMIWNRYYDKKTGYTGGEPTDPIH